MAIVIPPGPPRKSSGIDNKTARKLVIDALLEARKSATPQFLLLKGNGVHWLGELYRYEVILALKAILAQCSGLFAILPNDDLQKPSDEAKAVLSMLGEEKQWWVKWREAPEDAPILLGLSDAFDNWCEAQNHRRNITLRTLSEQSRQKVLDTVEAIYQQFELTSNPRLSISWIPASPVRDAEARRLSLEFLENKDAVTHHEFHYFTGGGYIKTEIDVKEFFRLRDELIGLYAPAPAEDNDETQAGQPLSPSEVLANIEGLTWQEINMQFVDGHNIKISTRDTRMTVDFKEMGFEDARSRMPNTQWHLLKLLADRGGEIDWNSSDASDNVKKRKQVLAETLKRFFKINDDPFHPYRDEKAYRLKFTIKAEGD